MANQQGIAIVIKAFLPTGRTLNEQFDALYKVKAAHETGDYSEVLKAAKIEEVKAEQKTRRIDDEPKPTPAGQMNIEDIAPTTTEQPAGDPPSDADVPEFLKKDKKSKAA